MSSHMARFLATVGAPCAAVPSERRVCPSGIRGTGVSLRTHTSLLFVLNLKPLRRDGKRLVSPAAKQSLTAAPASTEGDAAASESVDCVVVGGGISGLCTAHALLTEQKEFVSSVLVTEARERTGGNITTKEGDGYLWEEGPNSFQPNDAMLRCAVGVGLKDELVLGDPDSPRYVFWNGKLRPVPAGLLDLPVFDLMSIFGKLRAGLGALGLRPAPPGKEESVEEFVRRNLGGEVFERLIEPFCSGVYAGNPAELSMKAAFGKVWRLEQLGGSIIGGSIKLIQDMRKNPPPPRDPQLPKPKGQTVGSFRKGLITLTNALSDSLGESVRVNWRLSKIEKIPEGFKLKYETPSGEQEVRTKVLVLTVPSYVVADLVRHLAPEASSALEKIFYPPVAAVTISYPKNAVKPERLVDGELKGFGQLHPRTQGVETLGTIYSSSLFPGRAPSDRVLLLNYIGGALNPTIVEKTEEEIVKKVDADVRKMLIRDDAPPPVLHGLRVWPKAIPQFNVGHLDHLESARNALNAAGLQNLVLGGNYVAGVALGRCVEGAYESAASVADVSKSLISQ